MNTRTTHTKVKLNIVDSSGLFCHQRRRRLSRAIPVSLVGLRLRRMAVTSIEDTCF